MKTFYQSLLLAITALALAGTAYAQVPSTNDTSDGNNNTGMGTGALGGPSPPSLTGTDNTASGYSALASNTTGSSNTASGVGALAQNTTGNGNTATGTTALVLNTDGDDNTASGFTALYSNTSGSDNTASGFTALYSNTTGSDNTALGDHALYFNKTGSANTASGYTALDFNTLGDNNTAAGYAALQSNTTGSGNIAIGFKAGYNVVTGSNNIEIGSPGNPSDNGFIRIGTTGHQQGAFIAGINSSNVTGSAVYVTAGNRLGVLASSERFKTAIAPMDKSTEKLQQLRPVTFHLKTDPNGALQYGLIAEEVAKVYPELVIRNEAGRIDGVRYDELAPMLLNEVQQQAAEIHDLKKLVVEMHAALAKLQSEDELVAQR